MFSSHLITKAHNLIDDLNSMNKTISLAESCTGGLFAGLLTSIPGASSVFLCSYVTYSNQAKQDMIGVPLDTLKAHGAVSEETAKAMAEGSLNHSQSDYSISVTGIAGPGGGTAEKPVGLVYIGTGIKGADDANTITAHKYLFDGDRESIRLQTIETGLDMLLNDIKASI